MTSKRSPAARSGDAIGVSTEDRQSYAVILKVVKARVNPLDAGLEVLSVRSTRKDEILLVLKTGSMSWPLQRRSIGRSEKKLNIGL